MRFSILLLWITGMPIALAASREDDLGRVRDAALQSDFAWRLWHAEVRVRRGPATLVVRATDTRGRTQPETAAWNFKGYLNDSWHRVSVEAS